MNVKKWWIVPAALGVVAALSGAAVAANGGDDEEGALTGTQRDQAIAAALEFTGGGTAVEAEVGDGGAAYEVEVEADNGTVTEVELDAEFTVIGDATDDDGNEGADTDY